MGRHVGPSSTSHLMRASDPNRGPWLTFNAGSADCYRKALRALGVKVSSRTSKTQMWNALLQFPKADVQRAFGPKAALSDEDRDAAHERLRRAGFL